MTREGGGAGAVTVRAVAGTDTGYVRAKNEDSLALGDLDAREFVPQGEGFERALAERGPLFVICDGMGGTSGGDIASKLALEGLWTAMRDAAPTRDVSIYARHLRRGVRVANQLVFREAQERGLRGMGTTLSAAGLAGSTLVIAQVGDSRVYVERAGALKQVTRDQSVVSALKSAGRMTDAEAKRSVQRSMILQALGVRDDVEVSLSIAELCRGDRVLLCSDGLHGVVSDAAIERAIAAGDGADLSRALDELFSLARAAGAPDNVSAILAHFDGEALEPPAPERELAFTELDPASEGDGSLSATSRVARRLAARAGLRDDEEAHTDIVATRQHLVAPRDAASEPGPLPRDTAPPPGPATDALASRSRLGVWTWIAAALVAALVAFALWRIP